MNAISRACEFVGGVSKMAARLNLSVPTVSQWINEKRPVPLDHCPYVERATAGTVTCEQLRPDKAEYFELLRHRAIASPSTALAGERTHA